MTDDSEIARRFGYHPPRSRGRVIAHEQVRGEFQRSATVLLGIIPHDDLGTAYERQKLMEKLEEAQFWANAALARAPDPDAEVSAEQAAAGPRTSG